MRKKLLALLSTRNLDTVSDWLNSQRLELDDEKVQGELVALHDELNLFNLLNEITDDRYQLSIFLILKSIGKITNRTEADIYALSNYSRRVDSAFLGEVADEISLSIKDRPESAMILLEKIHKKSDAIDAALFAWAIAYAKAFPEDAFELLRCAEDSQLMNNFLYVSLLMTLARNPKFEQFICDNNDKVFKNTINFAEARPDSHIGWQVLCEISEFLNEAAQWLRNSVEAGKVPIAKAFLFKLATKNKKNVTSKNIPLSEFLIPILSVAIQSNEIEMQYGAILARLILSEATRDEVFLVLEHAERNLGLDLVDKFESLSHAIIMDDSLFKTLLTKRLMDKNCSSNAIRNLLQFCIVGQTPCDIDEELFASEVFEQRRRMMARLIAYTHNGPSLCSFAAVFAESGKIQPDGLEIAKSIIEYTIAEYPDSSEKFFLAKKKIKISSKSAKALYSSALSYLIRVKTEREALLDLDELKPSSSQRLAMIHQHIKTNRDINRAAAEKSIFSSIAKKVRILQGKKVATIMYDGQTKITEMGNMSYSVELPISERADPVGGLIGRINWLQGAE